MKISTENLELKIKNKIFSYEEILDKLLNIEIECIKIHSLSYELNADSFTNSEYMNWFNYSKSKVSSQILKNSTDFKELVKNNNDSLINDFLNSNFEVVEKSSKKDIKTFINDFKSFLLKYNEYANKSTSSLTLLIDFIENKRPDLYKICYNTLLENKKNEEKNKDSQMDKLKISLNKEREKNGKLDADLKSKEDELNDMESEIKKQNRTIKELNEQISELEQSYKLMN